MITVFSVNSGTLSAVAGSPFTTASGGTPAGMATDQGGTILYVAGTPNLVHAYTVAANGSLTQAAGSPFSTNQIGGELLSLASFPSKTCGAGTLGGPPPPQPAPTGATTVQIQISSIDGDDGVPGKPAKINLTSHHDLQVAILSTSSFNAATMVNMNSLTFGHSGTETSLDYCDMRNRDVNHDKIPDLVCHFKVSPMNFQAGDTVGVLGGMLLDGVTSVQGSAPVEIGH